MTWHEPAPAEASRRAGEPPRQGRHGWVPSDRGAGRHAVGCEGPSHSIPSGSPEASRDTLPTPSPGLAEPLGVGAESHPGIAIVVEAPPDGLVEQLELILEGRPAFGRRQLQEVE